MTTSLANARDMADAAAGLRRGVLYRSDAPAEGDGVPATCEPWPPATVIDLRGAQEKSRAHGLADASEIIEIDVMAAASLTHDESHRNLTSLESLYLHMTEGEAARRLIEAAARMASEPAPVLMHCTAGKDRTGVLAALILRLVDVDREHVVADYCATGPHMGDVISRMMAGVPKELEEAMRASVPPEVFEAPAHAIEVVLDRWDSSGGATQWYLDNGGDPATITALRERLLEASP